MNTQIYEEAALWLVELNCGETDSRSREPFYEWLRASPEHVRVYLELLPAWEVGAELPADGTLGVPELLHAGKSDTANVVSISPPGDAAGASLREARPARRRILSAPMAIAASVLVCLAGAATYLLSRQGLYVTDTGEQRIIRLADGSTIELNARSKLRVRFGDGQRKVELLEGQALFEVAHDALRPFLVVTDRTQVRAVGTEFDVNIKSTATVVTVVEGKVAIKPTNPVDVPAINGGATGSATLVTGKGELLLNAGEELAVASHPDASLHPKPTNIANATAWTQRHLVFDVSTLEEVVEEFNRYNTRHLILKDPTLSSFPITAAFDSPDPVSLVRFLKAQPDIEVKETSRAILIYKR